MRIVPAREFLSYHSGRLSVRQMQIVNIVERGLCGIALPTLTRPPVPFDTPDEQLALFGVRVYAYSLIAHLRTILAGVLQLDEAGNTPSARVLCRHIFEWAAHAAYVAENLAKTINAGEWSDAFDVVSEFDRANEWIRKFGDRYDAHPIQFERPERVRLKHWIAAYERFRVGAYGEGTADESYGYLSEHAHPSGACFLNYREICGADLRFVDARKAHLTDITQSLLDLLLIIHTILALSKEDSVREPLIKIIESVAALRSQR